MLGDLEGFIIFIPFIYLGLVIAAYLITRKKFP
jgi:flagellar biosynthesis protein FliP